MTIPFQYYWLMVEGGQLIYWPWKLMIVGWYPVSCNSPCVFEWDSYQTLEKLTLLQLNGRRPMHNYMCKVQQFYMLEWRKRVENFWTGYGEVRWGQGSQGGQRRAEWGSNSGEGGQWGRGGLIAPRMRWIIKQKWLSLLLRPDPAAHVQMDLHHHILWEEGP